MGDITGAKAIVLRTNTVPLRSIGGRHRNESCFVKAHEILALPKTP